MPTPALQPPLLPPLHTHTLNGSWPIGCQAGQKEGDSFCDPPCSAKALTSSTSFWQLETAKRAGLPGLGRACVRAQPQQLPEWELNVQCFCQSLLTSFFFLRAMQTEEAAEECGSNLPTPASLLPWPVLPQPPRLESHQKNALEERNPPMCHDVTFLPGAQKGEK